MEYAIFMVNERRVLSELSSLREPPMKKSIIGCLTAVAVPIRTGAASSVAVGTRMYKLTDADGEMGDSFGPSMILGSLPFITTRMKTKYNDNKQQHGLEKRGNQP